MQRFSARLIRSSLFGGEAMTLPPDLILTPQSWSATDRGGHRQASLSASGSAESLAYLLTWLGDRIEIYNEQGDAVFWGTLWDVEASLGNVTVSLSLDSVFNRVAVIYAYRLTDGTEESRTTAWVEDAESILRYGRRELLYGMPAAFSDSAESVRDQLLPRFSRPGPILRTQASGQYSASLTAMGNWYKTEGVYFRNEDGLVEHVDRDGVQVIGRYITSSGISFAASTTAGGLDDMQDTNGLLGSLVIGDRITISGAALSGDPNVPDNNDTFTVGKVLSSTTVETVEESFVNEAAGATIKVSWGESVAVDNLGQSFKIGSVNDVPPAQSWTATHVALLVRRVGSVSDNFRIGLYANNAGVPGLLLGANETAGAALFTELTWTEFALDVPVLLTPDTIYHIGIRRTGAANLGNGYEVAMDEGLGYTNGALVVYHNASSLWFPRLVDADMPFRVIGEISSTAQMLKALESSDAFLYDLIQLDSEIPIRQYMDTPQTALSVIDEMMDAGTALGYRLVSWVTFDNAAIVNVPELSSDQNLILDAEGKLHYPTGGLYAPGRLVYGQYVDVDSLLLLDSIGVRANRGPAIYVQASSYDASTDTLSIEGEGALDAYSALAIRKG